MMSVTSCNPGRVPGRVVPDVAFEKGAGTGWCLASGGAVIPTG